MLSVLSILDVWSDYQALLEDIERQEAHKNRGQPQDPQKRHSLRKSHKIKPEKQNYCKQEGSRLHPQARVRVDVDGHHHNHAHELKRPAFQAGELTAVFLVFDLSRNGGTFSTSPPTKFSWTTRLMAKSTSYSGLK